MEAVAKYTYHATWHDELSFKSGTSLLVLRTKTDSPLWYTAEQDGATGLIPSTYIQMSGHEWYRGRITHAQARELLITQPHDGAFLIRDSESTPEGLALVVKWGGDIHHFKMLRGGAGKFFLRMVKCISAGDPSSKLIRQLLTDHTPQRHGPGGDHSPSRL